MKINSTRLIPAFKAMTVHFGLSLLVAAIVAFLVFTLWFPYPYRELAGGRELFILVMAVDIVCGPLLTFVLFSPTKPKKELITDISLIAVIQILALCYGIWTVWQVRPLFVVQEADRFNIISAANIETKDLELLPANLRPKLLGGPIKVSLRNMTLEEREKLNAQIKSGGKDASELPFFYENYQGSKAYASGKSLQYLLKGNPSLKPAIDNVLLSNSLAYKIHELHFLYIVGREYWLAVISPAGDIVGYIEVN